MTREQIDAFIDRWMNTAVNGFNNGHMETVLKALLNSGVTGAYVTYTEFRAAYEADPTTGLRVFVAEDDEFGNDEVIYEYIPGVGVMLAGLELVEDLRT